MKIQEVLGASDETRLGMTSSSPFTGSPTFDQAPFSVDAGKRPPLGVYVWIEHDEDGVVHYGRINEGTEENTRADPSRLQQNQAYQVGVKEPRHGGDRAPHVVRVMMVEVLGQLRLETDGTLAIMEPEILPQTGRVVYEFPAERLPFLLGLPDDPEDGLDVGIFKSGLHSVECIMPAESLIRHTAILGKTGVGKSYAVGVLIEEYARLGIPVFSADILGDLVNETEDLGGKNYRAGENFQVHYAIIGTTEFMAFNTNLTKEQSEIVSVAYAAVNHEAIQMLNKTGRVDMPFQRLLEEIEVVGIRYGQAAVGTRAKQRVQAVLEHSRILAQTVGAWLAEMTSAPIINVFVGHLSQRERNLIVAASARLLQTLRRRDRIPPFMFVLDEAHFFLPSGGETTPSTGVIRELVRTARHDAVGIVLITQSPSSLDKQALLTCNTRVVFALDKDDVKVVSGTMGDLSESAVARIPKMSKGTAIISSAMDIIRHPVVVRIRRRRTREGAPTPNMAKEVQQWRQRKTN